MISPLRLWRNRRIARSAGVRFAAVYAVLLAISATALALFLWWATAGLLDRQTEATIQSDAQSLQERFRQGGTAALILSIENRLALDVEDNAIYLLADPELHRIAGNLLNWPPMVTRNDGRYELQVQRAGVRSLAFVQRYDLPNGDHLLVGRDIQARSQLRRLLTDALLWAMGVVLVMATIGGLFVRLLFRRALASLSATTTAIAAGDFGRRVPLSGRRDEFDQMAETVNEMLDRITRLMDGVRQVSNAIAHDLRTPITRARARLEEAASHAETEEELRAAIERATSDLDGIVAIFQGLLRIAEIEAGSRRAAFAETDLVPLLQGVAELYEAVAEEKNVRLELRLPERLTAYGDPALIQQAVANLIDNAVKFSPEGAAVRLEASAQGSAACITVADQGPGIPPEDRKHATERFFRGEKARSTPGSGLGLALVQAVAQLHGGRLELSDAAPGLVAKLFLSARPPQRPDAG
ncbi:MAG TPA: ATP-binding protein [Acetobacteraceae bacterium]|nr:ATP-binding protein [Acetobacteraceae bacterium]